MPRASRAAKAPRRAHPIVFLDIDGVLLPFGDDVPSVSPSSAGAFSDEALAALSHLIVQTDAKLVLSSTWRASVAAQAEIIREFARYAAIHGGPLGEIHGFEHMTSTSTYDVRQREIWDWLQRHGSTATSPARRLRHKQSPTSGAAVDVDQGDFDLDLEAWVALDDEPLLEGKEAARHRDAFMGHVVQTQSHLGLTMALAEKAATLLRSQLVSSAECGGVALSGSRSSRLEVRAGQSSAQRSTVQRAT